MVRLAVMVLCVLAATALGCGGDANMLSSTPATTPELAAAEGVVREALAALVSNDRPAFRRLVTPARRDGPGSFSDGFAGWVTMVQGCDGGAAQVTSSDRGGGVASVVTFAVPCGRLPAGGPLGSCTLYLTGGGRSLFLDPPFIQCRG